MGALVIALKIMLGVALPISFAFLLKGVFIPSPYCPSKEEYDREWTLTVLGLAVVCVLIILFLSLV